MTLAASPIEGRHVPDLSFLLTHAAHVLATRKTAAFAEIGLTPREYCVLAHAMGGEYTQIELAKLSDLDKTTMLNTLDFLEGEGYAERRPSPADRRARVIGVTSSARRRAAFTAALETLVGGLLAEPVSPGRPVRRARVPGPAAARRSST